MKKVVMKSWLEKVVKVLAFISFMLLMMSADSELSWGFVLFLVIDSSVLLGTTYLLTNYCKNPIDK
jgi:hypothetical protein